MAKRCPVPRTTFLLVVAGWVLVLSQNTAQFDAVTAPTSAVVSASPTQDADVPVSSIALR